MRDFKPNILTYLIAIVLLLAMEAGQPWTSTVPFVFGREEGKKPEAKKDAKMETPAPAAGTDRGPSNMPYTGLAEKNIFSPERKEFPIFATPEPTKKPPVRPQVVLYGVTIAGNYQSASIVQSGRALRKGEREMLTLRAGEQIGEYRLTKIMPDRIVLEGEGDSFEVLLYDPSKPKQRTVVKTEIKPATITSALPGPPASPTAEPPRPGTAGTPTAPTQEVPRPTTSSPAPGMERMVTPTPVTPPVPQAVTPGSVPTSTPITPPTSVPRRGSRIAPTTPGISTPQTPGESQGQGGA